MTVIVELPDGREVEFPEGTPPEVMNRAVQDFMGQSSPAPAPEAGPSTTLLGSSGNFAEGLNKGLFANFLGAPVDLINMAPMIANILPGEQGIGPIHENPVGGSKQLSGLLNDIGVTGNFEPQTQTERVIRRVGEEVGATAIPLAGATARAARLAVDGVTPMMMNKVDQAFTAPAQIAPARNAVEEVLIASGAGAGAQLLSEEFAGDQSMELVGGLGGGLATAGGMGAMRNGGALMRQALPGATDNAVKDAVGRTIAEAANNPAALSAGAADRAAEEALPGVNPTVSQATGDLGLEALEAGRRGGPNAGRFAERGAEQNAALGGMIDEIAPPGEGDAVARALMEQAEKQVADEFEAARAAAVDEARRKAAEALRSVDTADAEVSSARAAADPGVTKESASRSAAERAIGDGDDSAISVARAERNRLYGEVDDNAPVPTEGGRAAAGQAIDGAADVGSPPSGAADIAGIEDETVPFARAKKNLTALGDKAAEARRAGRDAEAREIEAIRDGIRADLEQAGDASDALKAANQNEAEVYAPRFREGAAADVRRGKVPEASYLDRALSSPDEADRFIKTVGDDEVAMKAARDHLMGDLTRNGVESLTARQVDTWLRRNQEVLERFPEVRDEVQGIGDQMKRGAQSAKEARAALKEAERGVADAEKLVPPSRDEAIKLYTNKDTARESVAAVMRGPNSRENLAKIMNMTSSSPEARDSIRRGAMEFMKRKVRGASQDVQGEFLTRPKALNDFLEDYGPQLKVIFRDDPQHLGRVKEIAESLNKINELASQAPLAKAGRRGDRMTIGGVPMTSIFSRIFAAESGRTSYRFVVSEGLAQAITRMREAASGPLIDDLLDEAMLDPKLAASLASRHTTASERRATRTINAITQRAAARAGRTGITTNDEGEE